MFHQTIRLLLLGASILSIVSLDGIRGYAAEHPATHLLPASALRGTPTVVTIGGVGDRWPVQVWADDPLLVVKVLEEKGKLEVTPAASIQPGLHYLRLFDNQGASKPLPFLIDWALHSLETEPNNTYYEAERVAALPQMVDGVLAKRGDVDTFAVWLQKGATFVASIDAHRTLQSPVDANLQILDRQGNILAQNLDHHGLDPQIVYAVPADGVYLVRVFGFPSEPNSTIEYEGKETYVYRLSLSFSDHWYGSVPLAMSKKEATMVQPLAYGRPPLEPRRLEASWASETPTADARWMFFDVQASGLVPLKVTEHTIVVEQNWMGDANPSLQTMQPIEVPCCLTGRITHAKERDNYSFSAKAGVSYRIGLESRSLGFAMDGVLSILDASGKQLVRTDDVGTQVDPQLLWKAPADGAYQVQVEDLHGQGGTEYLYRMTIETEEPRLEPTVGVSTAEGKVGKPIELAIKVGRVLETRPIRFRLESLPPGVTAEPVLSMGDGESATTVKLTLTGAAPLQASIRILGEPMEVADASKVNGAATVVQPPIPEAGLWLSIIAE